MRCLEPGIYHCHALPVIGLSLGPIIVLCSKLIIEATPEEISAVVAHERAHLILHSGWIRRWRTLSDRKQQEFEADAYVKSLGLGPAMARVLERYCPMVEDSETHPSTASRVALLTS